MLQVINPTLPGSRQAGLASMRATARRKSPRSLYREDYASFGEEDVYNQKDAHGFIQLFGLPRKVEALLAIDGGGQSRYRKPDYASFKRD